MSLQNKQTELILQSEKNVLLNKAKKLNSELKKADTDLNRARTLLLAQKKKKVAIQLQRNYRKKSTLKEKGKTKEKSKGHQDYLYSNIDIFDILNMLGNRKKSLQYMNKGKSRRKYRQRRKTRKNRKKNSRKRDKSRRKNSRRKNSKHNKSRKKY